MARPSPRSLTSKGARVALPSVNVSKQVNAGKRAPAMAKPKVSLPRLTVNPKPKVPDLAKPLGGGTGEVDPEVTPRNSPKGVKQRVGIKNPMSAI